MYLEVVYGGPFNRGTLISKKDLLSWIQKAMSEEEDLYRSMYLYTEDVVGKQIKGYLGPREIDNLILDIDKGDNSDELTLEKARELAVRLDMDNVAYIPHFSGTGYHIHIPKRAIGLEASPDLPFILRSTLKRIFPEVDSSIFMRTGIYRVTHTINKKSGLYKVPLSIKELMNEDVSYMHMMAKEPRTDFHIEYDSTKTGTIKEEIKKNTPKIKTLGKFPEPINVVTCVQRMISKGPAEGNRHKTVLRIASHFARHGIPSEITKVSLLHWNNNSLDEEEITRVVEQTYRGGYRYSCKDSIMSEHCSTKCIYFKRKDYMIEAYTAEELQTQFMERMTTDFTGRSINLAKLLGHNTLDCEIYPGELVTIFGPTGCNKTTFAQNIALAYNAKNDTIDEDEQISTLYLSLELSGWYMHSRHLQIVSKSTKKYVRDNYKKVYDYNKHLLSHITIQTISPTIKQIREKIREIQPKCVIVDYIDLIETPYKDEYGQIRYISHNLSNMAVNNDIIIIQLSQVSREYSRNQIMDLYAGKGSGAIENASRKVIGINGNAKSVERQIEVFKNSDGDLFKAQLEWTPSYRLRRIDANN